MGSTCRRALSALAVAAIFLAALSLPPLAGGPPRPFVPDITVTDAGLATLQGQSWVESTPEYSIRVQLITPEQRLAYIRHVTGLDTDPFATPPGDNKHFATFALQIENRGSSQLSFNPDGTWLMSQLSKDLLTPYGIEDLAFDFRIAGGRLPPAYKHAEKALLRYPQFVDPDATLSGLLVFRAVPNKSRTMRLRLAITLPNGDEIPFQAPYRRLTKKEVEEAASADSQETP